MNLLTHLHSAVDPNLEIVYIDHLQNPRVSLDEFCFTSKQDNNILKTIHCSKLNKEPLVKSDDPR